MESMSGASFDSRMAARTRRARRKSEGDGLADQHSLWNTWAYTQERAVSDDGNVAPSPLSGQWRDGLINPKGSGYMRVAGDDDSPSLVEQMKALDGKEQPEKPWEQMTCGEKFISASSGTTFQVSMALCILANAIVIGLETDIPDFEWWEFFENTFLIIFTLELMCRLSAYGCRDYFDYNGHDFVWNVFDFLIVGVGVCDALFSLVFQTSGGAATMLRMVRLLRILRVFRIVRFLKHLYMLAFGFALAAIAIFWVTVLMAFLLYVCAVVLTRTVGHVDADNPHREFFERRFGNIATSMLTLFELMSSPDLSPYHDILGHYPLMSIFLIAFIIFGSFGMIALLTGVISESMFEKNQLRIEEEKSARLSIVEHCDQLFSSLDVNNDGTVSKEELQGKFELMAEFFECEGVDCVSDDLVTLMHLLDEGGGITRGEFCNGLSQISEGVRPLLIMEIGSKVNSAQKELKKISAALTGDSDSVLTQTHMVSTRLRELANKVDALTALTLKKSSASCCVPPSYDDSMSGTLDRLFADLKEVVASQWNAYNDNAMRWESVVSDLKDEVSSFRDEIRRLGNACSEKSTIQAFTLDLEDGCGSTYKGCEAMLHDLTNGLASLREEVLEMRDYKPCSLLAAPQQKASIEGTWSGGFIVGTTLSWNDGKESTMTVLSPTEFTVMLEDEVYSAELKDDGKLYWSDDDVWEKKGLLDSTSEVAARSSSSRNEETSPVQELPAILEVVVKDFGEKPLLDPKASAFTLQEVYKKQAVEYQEIDRYSQHRVLRNPIGPQTVSMSSLVVTPEPESKPVDMMVMKPHIIKLVKANYSFDSMFTEALVTEFYDRYFFDVRPRVTDPRELEVVEGFMQALSDWKRTGSKPF